MLLERCDDRGEKIGAFLLEPLMLGAGGLKFVDPLFQKVVVRACRSRGIPIVYDEVKTCHIEMTLELTSTGY